MPITAQTLAEVDALRRAIATRVDDTTARIEAAWGTAWDELAPIWGEAVADILATAEAGRWPSRRQVLRLEQVQAALTRTLEALNALAKLTGAAIIPNVDDIVQDAALSHVRIAGTQLPSVSDIDLHDAPVRELDAIIHRATQDIVSLTRPLPADVLRGVKGALIRGVAVGENPRASAGRMVATLREGFDGGLNRALVIARTEMLDAHRAGGAASDAANAGILDGWQWVCALDRRTCPGCWSMHGRTFPLSTPGPEDHQQGRCARVPVTKPWRELGFDVEEPASILPDAEETFAALSDADRLAIMGRARLDLLDSGQVGWGELAVRRSTDGWRDSWVPAPVGTLRAS